MKTSHQALIQDPDRDETTDYILQDEFDSCWITVGKLSVQVLRFNGLLSVAIYPLGAEADDPIDRATAEIKP